MNERVISRIARLEADIQCGIEARNEGFREMQAALANGPHVIGFEQARSVAHTMNLIAAINQSVDDMETQVAFLKSLS